MSALPVFNFDSSLVTITRNGFNAQAQPVTRTIFGKLSHVMRLPYDPALGQTLGNLISDYQNQEETLPKDFTINGTNLSARFALDTQIYSGDTVSIKLFPGFLETIVVKETIPFTNTSTLQIPPVICNFASYSNRPVFNGETIVADVVAYHISATDKNQGISCVKFEVVRRRSGTTTTVHEEIVNTLTVDTNDKVPVYRLNYTLDTDITFQADDDIFVKATVYPYWGNSKSSIRAEYGSSEWKFQFNEFLDLHFVYEPTSMPTVYISPSGNDSTGDGSSGNPYATIKRAMVYLDTLSADLEFQGFILCKAGSYTSFEMNQSATTNIANKKYCLTIKPENEGDSVIFTGGSLQTDASTAALRNNAAFKRNYQLVIKDIIFDYSNAPNSSVSLDGITAGYKTFYNDSSTNNSTANITSLVFDNCIFKGNLSHTSTPNNSGVNNLTAGFMYWPASARRMYLNCSCIDDDNLTAPFIDVEYQSAIVRNNVGKVKIFRGDIVVGNRVWANNTVFYGIRAGVTNNNTAVGRSEKNNILCYNEIAASPSNLNGNSGRWSVGKDYAIVCNMLYTTHSVSAASGIGAGPTVHLFADSSTLDTDNLLFWHNTVAGERVNYFYNDVMNVVPKTTNISVLGNFARRMYIKSDLFAPINGTPQGIRVGNWSVMNGIDVNYNINWSFGNGNSFPPDHTKQWWDAPRDGDVDTIVTNNPYDPDKDENEPYWTGWPIPSSSFIDLVAGKWEYPVGSCPIKYYRNGSEITEVFTNITHPGVGNEFRRSLPSV